MQQHGQTAPLYSARHRLLRLLGPRAALAALGGLVILEEESPLGGNHCRRCSSEPPAFCLLPIPLPSDHPIGVDLLRIEERLDGSTAGPRGSMADLSLREPPLWPREPTVEQPNPNPSPSPHPNLAITLTLALT